jgi:copper resistance protein C
MRRLLIGMALLAAILPRTARGHAFLDHAVPAVGATLAAAPRQLQIFFTQQLEPAFSGATIAGADGKAVATGAASVNAQNPMELVLDLPPLTPGHYTVSWHVVSVDTHRTEGSFSFDIRP